ncbi:MAG: hypothetical protein JWO61_397 [Candidatus Saccharibacteria bacterium]|nr:hypothetical protein [Candidatus Saccharibacteria bacterium]
MVSTEHKGGLRRVILIVAVSVVVAGLILHQFCGVSPQEFVVGVALWAGIIAGVGICIALCIPTKNPM